MSQPAAAIADRLNHECDCVGTDVSALHRSLGGTLSVTHPHLFSEAPVFVAAEHIRQMQGVIDAVEAVTGMNAYRDAVLRDAPGIACVTPANRGLFLGFDFHISVEGPKLIEINTNPGGALLNLEAIRAQRTCCPGVADCLPQTSHPGRLEEELFEMFLHEWKLARGNQPLRQIAIVDTNPSQQYLYPEFLLFQRLFERQP